MGVRVRATRWIFVLVLLALMLPAAEAVTLNFTSSTTWTAPTGVTSITVEAIGGGGAGGAAEGEPSTGGGGGGGAYVRKTVSVAPGEAYTVTVGMGGTGSLTAGTDGEPSWFNSTTTVYAEGGKTGADGLLSGGAGAGGSGGLAANSVGDTKYNGGNGAATPLNLEGGGGGGGAGTTGAGGSATLGTGGSGAGAYGGDGADGNSNRLSPQNGYSYGGGGAGGYTAVVTNGAGGNGAQGIVLISYNVSFGCEFRTTCAPTETGLLRARNDTDGYSNAHAQLMNYSGTAYNNTLCCSASGKTLANSCTASGARSILRLQDTTNTHVQVADVGTYPYTACLSSSVGRVNCTTSAGSCDAGFYSIASMASSEDNGGLGNTTNAHIGTYGYYELTLCCKIDGQPPVVDSASISPSPTATTRDDLLCVNGSVSDPDGDTVTLHYNWYRNGTSITVLNLPMDYDSNTGVTHDISGYGNHGTVNGATFLPTGGAAGGGFSFDGTNDYIDAGNDAELNFGTGPFTILLWAKGSSQVSMLVDKKNGSSAAPGFSVRSSGTNIYFIVSNGTNTIQIGDDILSITYTPLIFIRNSSGIFVYQSTELIASDTNGGNLNVSGTSPLIIGANSSLIDSFFSGQIDEVIIFNRSISKEEIRALTIPYNQQLNGTELRRADLWNCSITPVDSTGLNGTTKYSGITTISGSPPLNVTLLYPDHNNNTVFERYVNFSWTAADERDGDQVNYTLNYTVQPGTCSIQGVITNILTTNRTAGELCYDQYYNWSVKACDIDGCSGYVAQRNFTIASVVSITLLNNNTNFGALNPGQSIDTETGGVAPFLIENDGNVVVNITLNASNSPFENAGLGTTAFQFKARVNETGAFNASGTQTAYTPVTAALKHLVKQLNYSDENDAVYTDINFTVPSAEPPGDKTTNVTFRAEVSS